jgi:hypothetical protein
MATLKLLVEAQGKEIGWNVVWRLDGEPTAIGLQGPLDLPPLSAAKPA